MSAVAVPAIFSYSYVMVDNFQRGVFTWPLGFAWNTLSEEQIKKDKVNVSDPLRWLFLSSSHWIGNGLC